jgi:hypothetical protein
MAGLKMGASPNLKNRRYDMSKKKNELAVQGETQIDENQLFERIAEIIETRKSLAGAYANREVTMMYWEVGRHINSVILDGGRAAYGKKILTTLSAKLIVRYGKSFRSAIFIE